MFFLYTLAASDITITNNKWHSMRNYNQWSYVLNLTVSYIVNRGYSGSGVIDNFCANCLMKFKTIMPYMCRPHSRHFGGIVYTQIVLEESVK